MRLPCHRGAIKCTVLTLFLVLLVSMSCLAAVCELDCELGQGSFLRYQRDQAVGVDGLRGAMNREDCAQCQHCQPQQSKGYPQTSDRILIPLAFYHLPLDKRAQLILRPGPKTQLLRCSALLDWASSGQPNAGNRPIQSARLLIGSPLPRSLASNLRI